MKYPEPFRGYHGSKLNRTLSLAFFSSVINSWLGIPALPTACQWTHTGDLHHSGNDIGKSESFGRVGGLGAGLAGAASFHTAQVSSSNWRHFQSGSFTMREFLFHILQSLQMEGWASNCAFNLVVWAAKIKVREIVQIAHLNTKEAMKAQPTQPNVAFFLWILYFSDPKVYVLNGWLAKQQKWLIVKILRLLPENLT